MSRLVGRIAVRTPATVLPASESLLKDGPPPTGAT